MERMSLASAASVFRRSFCCSRRSRASRRRPRAFRDRVSSRHLHRRGEWCRSQRLTVVLSAGRGWRHAQRLHLRRQHARHRLELDRRIALRRRPQSGGINARSQRDVAIGAGLWTVATDLAVRSGSLPAVPVAASLSVRDNPGDGFILALIAAWTNVATATNWEVQVQWSNAAGDFLSETLPAGFQNLQVNHAYRLRARFDFATNRVLSVARTDLATGSTRGRGVHRSLPLRRGFRGASAVRLSALHGRRRRRRKHRGVRQRWHR